MKYGRDINFIRNQDVDSALSEWKGDGRRQRIFALSHPLGRAIVDKVTFFDAVVNTFPLDPPQSQGLEAKNIDALQDSVKGGLRNIEEEIIDVVWRDVDDVAECSVSTLVEGVLFLLLARNSFVSKGWETSSYLSGRVILGFNENHPAFQAGFWNSGM